MSAQKPRKRSRSSSPGRRRSRSRSPSRRKTASPTRQPSSPRRPRSPGRSRRKIEMNKSSESSPPPKLSPKVDVQRVGSEKSVPLNADEKRGNVEEINTSNLITSTTTRSGGRTTSVVTRRTTRSVTRALEEETPKTQSEVSSGTCSLSGPCTVLATLKCALKNVPCLIGGVIAVMMPLALVLGMYLTCKSKKSCTILKLPTIPACDKFFNWKSTGYVFGWFLFQIGLSSLPIGKVTFSKILFICYQYDTVDSLSNLNKNRVFIS